MKISSINEIYSGQTQNATVVLTNAEPMAEQIAAMRAAQARHLIPARLAGAKAAVERFEKHLPQTLDELVKAVLNESFTLVHQSAFINSEQQDETLAGLLRAARSFSALHPRLSQLQVAAEELMLNALYSAPAMHKALTGKDYVFTGANPCRLQAVFTDKMALITCQDPVGSLRRDQLLECLQDAYTPGREVKRQAAGGAGLGCKLMLSNASAFYAVSRANTFTLVGCLIPLTAKSSELELSPKAVHLITDEVSDV